MDNNTTSEGSGYAAPAAPLGPRAAAGLPPMGAPDLDAMVARFLSWPLPRDFRPDGFISFARGLAEGVNSWPSGTNLLHAGQARAMLEHVLGAAPTPMVQPSEPGQSPEPACVRKHLTPGDIEDAIVDESIQRVEGTHITLCVLTLRNGARVIGHNYGAIDPTRQDWEMGAKMARQSAVEKVWELEGYALRERLHSAMSN